MGATMINICAKNLNTFKNSGCTNVSVIATMFNILVDKWTDTGALPRCGPKLSDVFNYPEKVRTWADSTVRENLRTDRQSKQLIIAEVVFQIKWLIEVSTVEALQDFEKSGCTNASAIVRMFAVLGKGWLDLGELPSCSHKLSDVLEFPERVRLWAETATTEEARIERHKKQLIVADIVMKMRALMEASTATKAIARRHSSGDPAFL
jgi:hypothetical protein